MMKIFIKRLIFFLTPIILVFFLLEYSLRIIPNDYSYKNDYLEKHASEIEVLILGNSHAYRGFIAENITLKSFNAAYISQSLDFDFLIFNKFKDNFKNLKFLIINVSYPSLFGSLKKSKESWRLKNYNLYYDFNSTLNPKNYSEILSNKYAVNKSKFVNYYKYNTTLKTCSLLGTGIVKEQRDIDNGALKAANRHTKKGLPYYKEYTKQLEKLIYLANNNNIKIIFVTTPAYYKYVDNLDNNQINKMNTILNSLTTTNKNVYRLNLLKSKNYYKNDFADADHLNKMGAIKLTSKINSIIERLNNLNKNILK